MPTADFGVYFMLEVYFNILSLYLVKKSLGKSVSVEIKILKALIFSGGTLRPYSTGFLIYGLTGQGFPVVPCVAVAYRYKNK